MTARPPIAYPSSVNRGYFSYSFDVNVKGVYVQCIHPLSIEAISPTRTNRFFFRTWYKGIHPLSIEAISPTRELISLKREVKMVSILCQSRLFLLPGST